MYCPACGVSVAQGLSYCNYCGAKLNEKKGESLSKSSEVKSETLIQGMIAVFVCGLGAIIGLMAVMKAVLDLNVGLILAFTLLSFLIMLVIEGVFIRLLLHRTRGAAETSDTQLSKKQTTKELDAAQARALPEAMPSVTEHTTRSFEPTYSERKSK
jgi:hypothetical protein